MWPKTGAVQQQILRFFGTSSSCCLLVAPSLPRLWKIARLQIEFSITTVIPLSAESLDYRLRNESVLPCSKIAAFRVAWPIYSATWGNDSLRQSTAAAN